MVELNSPFNPKRLSDNEIEVRALEAEALLNHSIFRMALDDVYSRSLGTLLGADIGSLTASTAHASMKAITDIKAQLNQYISDHKMRQKYTKGDK
jgi:hypothetical protein